MNKKKLIGNTFLLMTALIWGLAFVAQRVGMDYVGPLTFTAIRFWLGAAVLLPVLFVMNRKQARALKEEDIEPSTPDEISKKRRSLMIAGGVCGTILFMASIFQQFGLVFTTAGKAGFITALYIVLVPIFGLFLKQRPGILCWIGVVFGTIGLYFLTITEALTIAPGDFIVLIGAFFWAAHVLAIDHFNPYVDGIKLAITQFAVCACWGTIGMLIFERPSIESILSGAIPILYAGILSCGGGFTFQILGQKHTSPTVASLILSMEAVFGAVFGFLLLHEIMSLRELSGCVLMFVGVIVSQLPEKKKLETSDSLR
ncbi:MAG: DMT family transporter [Anaerovoracaceae bacterium]|jgi:drug/metabolite transporter (DMT)-like permease